MTRIILVFGLISSVILSILMFSTFPLMRSGAISYDNAAYVGFGGMIIGMVTIFFGVKSYRDNHLNGSITFGKAIGVGLLIALVASIGYSISWEFYFNLLEPDFMDKYAVMCIDKAKSTGASEAEMKEVVAKTEQMQALYKIPVARFGITTTEPLPVGILWSLFSAAMLRKKSFLPATPTV